ncbi:hypothetical protein BC628DRAFT_1422632 [Trametes gibbosa]|uniref:Uncharacterized protein n=1 Tax=Trametes gibbosa TaxID=160864 RepID=A0A6G6FQ54_9APHY|nr:hypothetical protein BC628DRAFT_1422632 [Trametes gibbosa]QIE48408.1 hypothetical protein [Trametes gibbosa]
MSVTPYCPHDREDSPLVDMRVSPAGYLPLLRAVQAHPDAKALGGLKSVLESVLRGDVVRGGADAHPGQGAGARCAGTRHRARRDVVWADAARGLQLSLGGAPESPKVFFDVVRRCLAVNGDDADVRAAGISPHSRSQRTTSPARYASATHQTHSRCRAHTPTAAPASSTTSSPSRTPQAAAAAATKSPHAGAACPSPPSAPSSPLGQEVRLLDATFLGHIHSRAQVLKHCPTGGLRDRVPRARRGHRAPLPDLSRARVRAFCHVEAHDGLGCAEYKDQVAGGDASFQR